MDKIKYLLVIIISSGLSACASHSANYEQELAQAPNCCDQLNTIHYYPATYDKPITVKIGGKKSPARLFAEGKSYFAAIELPAFTSAYEVQVTSLPINKKLFWPNIQILNTNFQIIKDLSAENFSYSNGELRYSFFINQDLGYRYLMIYTTPSLIGKAGDIRQTGGNSIYIPAGAGAFNMSYGVDQKQRVTTSAGGSLQIKLARYQPQKLK